MCLAARLGSNIFDLIPRKTNKNELNNEKKGPLVVLVTLRDCTTQLYGDYNQPLPIQSMYSIFTYIWLIFFIVNVGKYTIVPWIRHG